MTNSLPPRCPAPAAPPSAGQPQNRDIFHADNRDIFRAY